MNDRPRTRPVFVITGLVVLALAAGLLLWRAGARHRMEGARGRFTATAATYHLDLGHPPAVPRNDNVATWLRAAADLVDQDCVRSTINPLAGRPPTQWTPAERERAAACVASNREVLDLLHRASRCSASNWKLRFSLQARIPPVLHLLQCSRLLAASVVLHLDRGETTPAMDDLAAIATIARSFENEKQLISLLIGGASENLLLATIGDAIGAARLGVTQAPALEAMLPSRDLVMGLQEALGVEATINMKLALGISAAGFDDSSFAPATTAGNLLVHAGSLFGIPWRETLAADFYDLGTWRLHTVATPYVELRADPPEPISPHFPSGLVVPPSSFGPTIVITSAGRMQETMAWRDLTRAGLALLRQAAPTGHYPATLPEEFRGRQLFCNCPPTLELREDGSVRIFLPGAQELSDALWSWAAKKHEFHHLVLELPAPAK